MDRDSEDIAERIRARIDAGTLPTAKPSRVWAGYGQERPCSACDRPITAADIEYEIEVSQHGCFLFHQSCFTTWHDERTSKIAGERGTLLCSVCGRGINTPADMEMDAGKPRHVTCRPA